MSASNSVTPGQTGTAAGIDVKFLDYNYIKECTNAEELEEIILALSVLSLSGNEGYDPRLPKFAEKKLQEINLKSSAVSRKDNPAHSVKDLDADDKKTVIEDLLQIATPAVRTSEEYKTKKEEVELQLKNCKVEAKDLYALASLLAKWKPNDSLPVCLFCRTKAPKKEFDRGHLIPLSIFNQANVTLCVDARNGKQVGKTRLGYRAFCSKCEQIFSKYGEKYLNPEFFKKIHDQPDNELTVHFDEKNNPNPNWFYFAIMSIVWRCLCFATSSNSLSNILEDLRKFLRKPSDDDDIDSRVRMYLFAPNNELESKWKADNEAYKRIFQELYTATFDCDGVDNPTHMGVWLFMGPIHVLMTYSSTKFKITFLPFPMSLKDLHKAECCRFKYTDKTICVKKKQERFFPLSMYEKIVEFGLYANSQNIRVNMETKSTPFSMQAAEAILLPVGAYYRNGTFSIPDQFTKKFECCLIKVEDRQSGHYWSVYTMQLKDLDFVSVEELLVTNKMYIVGACRGKKEEVIFIALKYAVKYHVNGEAKFGPMAIALKVNKGEEVYVSLLDGVHVPSKDKLGGYDLAKEIPFKKLIEGIIRNLIENGLAKWH